MKKHLKLILIIIVAIIIILVSVYFIVLQVTKNSAKKYVNTMFSDIKTGEVNNISKYIDSKEITNMQSEEGDTENTTLKILLKDLNYSIDSTKISFKECKIRVTVSNKDIKTTLTNYSTNVLAEILNNITTNISDNDIETKLDAYLEQAYENSATINSEVELCINKENGEWKIENSNDELTNSILPGYSEYLNQANSTEENE